MSTREAMEDVSASILASREMMRLVARLKESMECFWAARRRFILRSRVAFGSSGHERISDEEA